MQLQNIFLVFSIILIQASANATTQADNDWFIRIIAESPAEGLVDRSNILGQTASSNAKFDKHDLPEKAPFGDTYLSVVFKHNDWQENAGEYNSDFKSLQDENLTWTFTVKSDDPSRSVTLKWEGEKYLDQMLMVDLLTGQEFYPVIGGKAQEYTFNMGGHTERDFLWKH